MDKSLGRSRGMLPQKVWNWEALKGYFTHSLLEICPKKSQFWRSWCTTSWPHASSLATALTVLRQGKSRFIHIPENLCYPKITLYKLHTYYFTKSRRLRNWSSRFIAGGWHLMRTLLPVCCPLVLSLLIEILMCWLLTCTLNSRLRQMASPQLLFSCVVTGNVMRKQQISELIIVIIPVACRLHVQLAIYLCWCQWMAESL